MPEGTPVKPPHCLKHAEEFNLDQAFFDVTLDQVGFVSLICFITVVWMVVFFPIDSVSYSIGYLGPNAYTSYTVSK